LDNFWIIGGGRFGLRAAKTLRKKHSLAGLTIVEKRKTVCRQLNESGFKVVCMDGIQYLERNLLKKSPPDWIVPAIPLHVAFEWITTKVSKIRSVQKIPIPLDLVTELPNPITARTGQLYISIADFECPGNCVEPEEICTHTGKPRSMVLHEFLKSIQQKGFITVVIQSHQLAPGVGGFRPADLYGALEQIQTEGDAILLATACSCHGVANTFKLSAKSE
jgi:hypothetical protein